MQMVNTIYIYDQDFFKKWLKAKGYEWVDDPVERENMLAEFSRDTLSGKYDG